MQHNGKKTIYVFQEYSIHFTENDVLLTASRKTQTFQERAVVELENDLAEREKAYLSVPMTCSQVQPMSTANKWSTVLSPLEDN